MPLRITKDDEIRRPVDKWSLLLRHGRRRIRLRGLKRLPLDERVVHQVSYIRYHANMEVAALCESATNANDRRLRHIGRLFSKMIADSDESVLDKALDALIAYLNVADARLAIRYAGKVCDAVVVNCFTRWPKMAKKAETVLLLWVELEAAHIFLDAMEKAIKHEVSRVVVSAIDVMSQALSDFGPTIVSSTRITKMLPELFDHKGDDIHASTLRLTYEIARWVGVDSLASSLFSALRFTLPKELVAKLVNVSGFAKPIRYLRSDQDREPEPGPSEQAAAEISQEFEVYEPVDPVDILTPLQNSGFWKLVKSSNWHDQKEAVAKLTKLSSTKKIANGDFLYLVHTLAKLITDAPIIVAIEAVKAIGNLASGLKSDFAEDTWLILPTLLRTLEVRKHGMMEALLDTLQAVHTAGCVTLADVVEDIKTAVRSRHPIMRSLTLQWVTHCIETSDKDIILKVYREYVEICMKCLDAGTPSAFSVLKSLAKIVGMSLLEQHLQKLDDVKKELLYSSVASSSGAAAKEKNESVLILDGGSKTFILPGFIKEDLFPHQVEGIRWLWKLHLETAGGLLGDDMGLGKTRQIAAFVAGLFESGFTVKVLLVCPKTLLPQWSEEMLKMGLPRCFKYYHAENKLEELAAFQLKDKAVLITTYDLVRSDIATLKSISFDYTFIDEGHTIKNPVSKIATYIQEIKSPHRIILTGTPVQNTYEELHALFSFCNRDVLGPIESFLEAVKIPLLKGINKFAHPEQKLSALTAKKHLDTTLSPYLLRRTKAEVFVNGEIPSKRELVVWLTLTEVQKEIYKSVLQCEVFRETRGRIELPAMTLLRKICGHPVLTLRSQCLEKRGKKDKTEKRGKKDKTKDVNAEDLAMAVAQVTESYANYLTSCKISFVKSLVVELVGEEHRILIFSEWTKMLDLVEESLQNENVTCLRLDGGCSDETRKSNIKDFQSGKADVFLLTTAVGGVGITLTRADRVILVDPAWNPSNDNQSVDRAYRLGQENNVVVYRVLTAGTVEERIYKTQVRKSAIINTVFGTKLECSCFSPKEKGDCFKLKNFELSSEVSELLIKQDAQQLETDPVLRQLNSMPNVAGILNHYNIFPERSRKPKDPPPKDPPPKDPPPWYLEFSR